MSEEKSCPFRSGPKDEAPCTSTCALYRPTGSGKIGGCALMLISSYLSNLEGGLRGSGNDVPFRFKQTG
jgi:hypothetical protein